MGEETMKKMVYKKKTDEQIIFHENQMLALYIEKTKKYIPFFEEKGYFLKVGLMWKRFPRDTVMFQRGSFQNGYQCYVYCVVQKDGHEVRIDSIDGEVNYYSLSTAWMISSIFRKFCKLNVTFYVSIDDVDTDLNGFLSQLKYIK